MTEEQIKQNAEEYAIKGNTRGSLSLEILYMNTRDAYIAGAHSRDEEIKKLEQALAFTEDVVDAQKKELDEHPKNPWISVEERLPEKHRQIKIEHGDAELDWISAEVIFIDDDGDCFVGMYDFGTEQWVINQDVFLYYHDVYDGGVITHWMPIPQIKKGE